MDAYSHASFFDDEPLASTSTAMPAYLYSTPDPSSSDFASLPSSSSSSAGTDEPVLDTWRVPPSLFTVFVSFYAAVFFCGLIGNTFVVAAIAMNKTFRTATDWLISSLAIADLLILVFCLPSTLLNNLLTEWQLGSWGCKLSVWVNSTTSCASIFTLVGVTGDRYLAICHPLRQLKMKNSLLHWYILGIWLLSALLASPNLWVYRQILYDLVSGHQLVHEQLALDHHLVARLCVDTSNNIWLFIVINLFIAFLVPIVVICVLYALIFRAVSRHTRKKLAVDNGARIRDERVKLRIAQMMFTVIVVFVLCWMPLYGLYCYFFMAEDRDSMFFQFASSVLRPIFQWLSLLSSSLNPLIYIAFSQKYRRAFHSLLLFPCRRRYKEFKQATRSTFRRSSCFSEKPSTVQLFSCQPNNGLRGEENVCANYMFINNNSRNNESLATNDAMRHQQKQQQQRKVSFTMATTACCMSPAMTRRKMSEQQQSYWRPSPPPSSSSSLLTTSCDGSSVTTTTPPQNNTGTMMASLLRRVALENSQRQQRKELSVDAAGGDGGKERRDDAERRRRQWRESTAASPQRRACHGDSSTEDNTPRRHASHRRRSADPLLQALTKQMQNQADDDDDGTLKQQQHHHNSSKLAY
uniref:G-protein coupled receptors family 1 profile domain-containing protein n=1 Tax=Globodera rostochiensis TaxID=31243 RepID=A0A914I5W1_GLORO